MLFLLQQEFRSAYRQRSDYFVAVAFFVLIALLFPLSMKSSVSLLQTIGPGVIWVAALLATLLQLDYLFRQDYVDGVLEQWYLSTNSFSGIVAIKVFVHWAMSALPLIVLAPLLAKMYYLDNVSTGVLMLTLVLGTPILSLLGSIIVALTLSLENRGLLLALLVLPLYLPVLIFACSAISAAQQHIAFHGQLLFITGLLVLAISLVPWTTAAALKIGME